MQTNLNALKTFIAVIESGSVVGAARARGYSAAAVSRQVALLQDRIGVRLIEPAGRTIRPTAEGLAYAERARQFVEEIDRFERYSSHFSTDGRCVSV